MIGHAGQADLLASASRLPWSIAREVSTKLELVRAIRRWPVASGDSRSRVLITGSGGRVGSVLRMGLDPEFAVLGLDVRRTPTVDRVGDARRLVRGIEALEGVDAIVDLASDPNQFASWKTVIRTNIASTTAVLEAARRANVPRVIVASSNHVTGGYLNDQPYASILAGSYEGLEPGRFPLIGVKNPVRPDGPYAVGKVFAEVAGRYYADTYGLSVICLRIGHVNRENRPKHTSHWATLLTHRDLVELVRVCLTAPTSVRFGIFYGVSDNTWRIWDIDDGRKLLGYEPRDDVEALR